MGLLKVLYFAHAWHLAKYKTPLVGQSFEAWKYGPVNRVVYDQIKKFGRGTVNCFLTKIDVMSGEFVEIMPSIDAEKATFLENIYNYYAGFHPYKLSDITHEKGTPWDTVWTAAEESAIPGMLIPNDLILEWFEKTGGRLYHLEGSGANA